MRKSIGSDIDSATPRNNFKKIEARNFQIQVNPLDAGIGSVIDSAIGIIRSDNRYARLGKRIFSQTFLRGFDCKNMAEHIASNVCGRMNIEQPEINAIFWVSVDRDDSSKFTVIVKTTPVVI